MRLQFFVLDVVVNSIRLSDDNIYAQLKRIVQMAEERQAAGDVDHVGILTGGKRDVWAAARDLLAKGAELKLSVVFCDRFGLFISQRLCAYGSRDNCAITAAFTRGLTVLFSNVFRLCP